MQRRCKLGAALILLHSACHARCQTTHVVVTGASGSFFDPPTISARENDTVTFVFRGDVHGVTQSSYEHPCTPLSGGFSSSLLGQGPDLSGPILTWDVVVKNASEPLWFFCQALRPVPHCAAGMVGVINPPSIDKYNDFVRAAKMYAGPFSETPSLALTGQGAFATAAPALLSTSLIVQGASVIPPQTSADPTARSSSSSRVNIGVIVGATAGGVVLILVVLGFLFVYWRMKKRALQRMKPNPYTEGASTSPKTYNSYGPRTLDAPLSPTLVITPHGLEYEESVGTYQNMRSPYHKGAQAMTDDMNIVHPRTHSPTYTMESSQGGHGCMPSRSPSRHGPPNAQRLARQPSMMTLSSRPSNTTLHHEYSSGAAATGSPPSSFARTGSPVLSNGSLYSASPPMRPVNLGSMTVTELAHQVAAVLRSETASMAGSGVGTVPNTNPPAFFPGSPPGMGASSPGLRLAPMVEEQRHGRSSMYYEPSEFPGSEHTAPPRYAAGEKASVHN